MNQIVSLSRDTVIEVSTRPIPTPRGRRIQVNVPSHETRLIESSAAPATSLRFLAEKLVERARGAQPERVIQPKLVKRTHERISEMFD